MPSVITVVAYKPSGETYCRGHVMDSWDSDLEIGTYDEVDEAARFVAQKLFENEFNSREKNRVNGDWSVSVFVNGKHSYDYDESCLVADLDEGLTEPENALHNLLRGKASGLLRKRIEESDRARKEAEKRKAREKEVLEKTEKERRRELYESLKKEFG